VPSTFTVLNTNDSGPDSLRAAIEHANLDPAQDTITFDPTVTGTITLSSALPDLSTSITVDGPGASALTVARSAAPGTPEFGIFHVTSADVTISGMTITRGSTSGITNHGKLTLTNSLLSGNSSTFGGGGISNGGTLTVINSTFSGNSASDGGGIDNGGPLTVINSTFSGNSARNGGGGVNNRGPLMVINSTFSGNSASDGGGGITNVIELGPPGTSLGPHGTLTVTTSLFANPGGNYRGPDFGAGTPFVSGGHNLFSDMPTVPLDHTDLTNTDPLLGPLADNGGPTLTQALLPGSPAIDAGAPVAGVSADERGVPRPQGAAPDIGAFERAPAPFVRVEQETATQLVGTSVTVTATVLDPDLQPLAGVPVTFQVTSGPDAGATVLTDPADGRTDAEGHIRFAYGNSGLGTDVLVATAAPVGGPTIASLEATVLWTTLTVTNTDDSGVGSLRAAIAAANQHPGRDTITFAPEVAGTITLSDALPDLSNDTMLIGPGAAALTVTRSAAPGTLEFGIFHVTADAEVTISGLTITGGSAGIGRGISNQGTLTLLNSTVSNNAGGGISNSGTLTIGSSTLSGNMINGFGGGVYNLGTMTISNSTLSGNTAYFGGGIFNSGMLTISNSTLSGNTAQDRPGGEAIVYFGYGGGISNSGTLTLISSTLSGNSASIVGGIDNSGSVTVTTSLFANTRGNYVTDSGAGTLFVSGGHNLFSDMPTVPLDPTDLTNTDPLLGPLADNGGPTSTQALLPGSPAIDAGAPIAGVTTDQRGFPRPQGSAPDIGAFESDQTRPPRVTVGPGGSTGGPGGSTGGPGGSTGSTPPGVTRLVAVTHSRKGITQLVLGFNEDLIPGSATNSSFYSLAAGVTKRRKLVFTKPAKISSVSYDSNAHTVTLKLAKPVKGQTQVTVHAGIVAANGASSRDEFRTVVK
jgi:hypothetical protein